jgi:predicted CXXCH cytochrome family protein
LNLSFPRLVALAAFFVAISAGAAQSPKILFPPDLTLATEPKVKVFAFRADKGGPDNVSVNGVPAAPLEGEVFLKGEVALYPGLNLLSVGGTTTRVFLLSGVKLDSFRIPSGKAGEELVFRTLRLHPALDDGCEGCHSVEGGKLKAKDQKEACYACHNDFSKGDGGKKVFLHAPVASGECTGCHDPHFSARPKLQKLEKGCLECHDPFPEGKSVHEPVADGECVSCHSPHAGPAPKQLVRPGNSLCLGCHEDPHSRHRSAVPKGTMTVVPEDFPKEKGELSCSGCHVPHQSSEANLFRMNQQKLCGVCHRM